MPFQFNESVWFVWPQPAVPFLLDLTLEACGDRFRQAFGFPFFTSVLYYHSSDPSDHSSPCHARWVLRRSEGVALGRILVDLLSLPSFARAFEHEWEVACKSVLAESDVLRNNPGAAPGALGPLCEKFAAYYALGAITEPIQLYCEEEIASYVGSAAGAALADRLSMTRDELVNALFTTSDEPYAFVIERVLLEAAMASRLSEASDESFATAHANEYWWKANNYARVHRVTPAEVLTELKSLAAAGPAERRAALLAARQNALSVKAKVLAASPPRLRRLSQIADEFGSGLADRRKVVMNQALGGLDAALGFISEGSGVTRADVAMLSPAEALELIGEPDEIERLAQERRQAYVQVLSPSPLDDMEMASALTTDARSGVLAPRMSRPSVAQGADAIRLLEELDLRMDLLVKSHDRSPALMGAVVAVTGTTLTKVRGKCHVVSDPIAERESFMPGEILVASSTTPDYVPLMRQARAIITNMGGMLQHAAHFAREENKPCIVGTGFATSALATGDQVELDLATGVITQIAGSVSEGKS